MTQSSTTVQKLTAGAAETWSKVGDQQIFVSDLIDQGTVPEAKMTVGYARVGQGETLTSRFPYDEVLVLTKGGGYTVRTEQGEALTVGAGDVIYLPADSTNTFEAAEDTEMVYVANPPSVYAEHVAASMVDQ
ncbi:hypothetical protein [Aeromicrobium sp.]|uniref:hypothetical protein n=1 Tax=Aeromicrobium sp. TaxID=1871063 RepID=UPI0030C49933